MSGTRRMSSTASSGGSPNFDPWCAVFTASCVSASIPGVTRTRKRATPAACARSSSSERVENDERVRLCRSAQQLVLLVVPVHHQPRSVEPRAERERELACGRDVGADALLGKEPQHRDRRERLRPVGDERVRRGRAIRARLVAERRLVVDDERRPELAASSVARTPPRTRAPSSIDAWSGSRSSTRGMSGIVADAMLALLADLAWRRPRRILVAADRARCRRRSLRCEHPVAPERERQRLPGQGLRELPHVPAPLAADRRHPRPVDRDHRADAPTPAGPCRSSATTRRSRSCTAALRAQGRS